MVTYGDYFSRKTLHVCGVSPGQKMFEKSETAYTGMQRMEKIRLDISEIYQTLYHGFTKNNALATKQLFEDFHLDRKIISAFYDSGILNNAERSYLQSQSIVNLDEREQICVTEANVAKQSIKTQKVSEQVKIPLERNMRQ